MQVDQKDGDESMKFKLRVKGDLHIGGLMLKLVEKISECLRWVKNNNLLMHSALWVLLCLQCVATHLNTIEKGDKRG